uniref:Ankyrin repeat protein n=1 Tax=Panagrolaimus sp. ES5 TaxID=591445 RepID=A0AC34F9I0_9BILA
MNVPEVVKAMLNNLINKEILFQCICIAFKKRPSLNIIKAIFEFPKIHINLSSTDKSSTFLHIAIENECEHQIIDYLLSKGADPNIADADEKTPWISAIEMADDNIIQIFLTKFGNVFGSKIEVMTEYFMNPNIFDANLIINGKSRLHQAIDEKNTELCKFLLQKGANVHLKDPSSNGKTPISHACENDLYEVVKWLLYYGANYDDESITVEKNEKIQKILDEIKHIFAEMRIKEFRVSDCEGSQYIDMLPPSMAKMKYIRNATNKYQQNLWHIAAKSGFLRNLRQFDQDFSFKKTINNQDIYGNTPLHYAVKSNKKDCVRCLLNMGAYYDIRNKNDETPQVLATLDEIKKMLEMIDEVFTIIKAATEKCLTLNREYIVEIYDIQNSEGKTMFHYAVINNNMSAIKQLIHGSYKNIKDINGYAPLFYAVKEGKYEMMMKLIDRNAIYDPKLYKNLDKNECTEYLHKIQRRHFLVCNENVEEIKREIKSYTDNYELNIITGAFYSRDFGIPKIESKFDPRRGEEMKTIWKYAEDNYELILFLLQNGIAPKKMDIKNLRIIKLISLLRDIETFIKEIDQDSLINYCEGYVTNKILYLLNPNGKNNCNRNDTDKIFANFRIKCKF